MRRDFVRERDAHVVEREFVDARVLRAAALRPIPSALGGVSLPRFRAAEVG
jgi:hypothetical protein